jgi:hypothetical protein
MTRRSGWKPDTPQVLERVPGIGKQTRLQYRDQSPEEQDINQSLWDMMSNRLLHEEEMSRRNETTCWATNHVDEGNEFISVSRTNARQADGFVEGGTEVVLDLDRVVSSCGLCELTRAEAVDLAAALLAAVVAPLGKANR